jgi:hypothetical protein
MCDNSVSILTHCPEMGFELNGLKCVIMTHLVSDKIAYVNQWISGRVY